MIRGCWPLFLRSCAFPGDVQNNINEPAKHTGVHVKGPGVTPPVPMVKGILRDNRPGYKELNRSLCSMAETPIDITKSGLDWCCLAFW